MQDAIEKKIKATVLLSTCQPKAKSKIKITILTIKEVFIS